MAIADSIGNDVKDLFRPSKLKVKKYQVVRGRYLGIAYRGRYPKLLREPARCGGCGAHAGASAALHYVTLMTERERAERAQAFDAVLDEAWVEYLKQERAFRAKYSIPDRGIDDLRASFHRCNRQFQVYPWAAREADRVVGKQAIVDLYFAVGLWSLLSRPWSEQRALADYCTQRYIEQQQVDAEAIEALRRIGGAA